jgi:hypothetical protein
MKSQERFGLFLVSLFILSLSSCSSTEALKTPDAEKVTSIGNNCKELYQGHTDAWNSRDPENLRLIYTDDIVHFDGKPLYVGIDNVVGMAKGMFEFFPDWQMEAGETFISRDECLGTWVNWGVFGFTQDNPGLEFDLLETRDGEISFWRLFYDQNFFDAIPDGTHVEEDFLTQFANSWTRGDMDELLKIYSPDVQIEDTLFGISDTGQQATIAYANDFFAKSPGASWELLYPFAEDEGGYTTREEHPLPSEGGVFAITVKDTDNNPCEIRVALILTPDDDRNIQTQKIFYEADTLLACGWVK